MKYLHDACNGEVKEIVGHEGCYDDNYGYCTNCGMEGELITKDTDEVQDLTFVSIEPVTSRYELPASDPPGLP
jgi:hypothetical protein